MGGTIKDAPNFDAAKEAEALRKAMKGLGTDEKAIINVVCKCSNKQRQKIIPSFKQQFGRDLIDDLKSEIGGNFLRTVLALFRTPAEQDAFIVHEAIAGAGTDEEALIEVICTRNNAEIKAMKEAYEKMYKKDMEKAVMGDTSGDFKRLLVSLLTGTRDEKGADPELAKKDAEALYKAGEGRLGTDESKFNQILCTRSYKHLRLVYQEYKKFSNKSIKDVIKSEMSGDLAKGFVAVVRASKEPERFFAKELYRSMEGAGTRDNKLIRIIVTRSEVDLADIKKEFERIYKKSLYAMVKDDTSGDYKNTLLAIIGKD